MGLSPLAESDEAPLPLGFTEYKDSGKEDYNWKEGKADLVRIFDGVWEQRLNFIFNHVLPQVSTADGETVYSSPNVYPDFPSARAYRASIEGKLATSKDESTGMIKHRLARITVYYSTPDFVDDSDGSNRPPGSTDPLYVVESVDTETEILPIPARKFVTCYYGGEGDVPCAPWQQGDGGFETEAEWLLHVGDKVTRKITELGKVPYRINRFNYKLKLPYVLFPRWADIDYCLGKLNYIPITMPSGLFAPPETLRYDGLASVTKRELSRGALVWEMEHKFCYYKPGWNTVPECDEDTGKIVNTYLTPPLYGQAIHQRIFVPYPNSVVEAVNRWWRNVTIAMRRRLYNPTRETALTQEEIRDFLNDTEWRGTVWIPWRISGLGNSLWSGATQ
jgi:hypothetical protein